MKKIETFALALLTGALSLPAVSAENWQDYKCFFEDTQGEKRVHFFQLQPIRKSAGQRRLIGRHVLDSFGQVEATVKEVHECVRLNQSFVRSEAKQLDKLQAR